MTALSILVAAALVVAAALDPMRAIGVWWPIRDEAALARAAMGVPGVTRMPGAAACAGLTRRRAPGAPLAALDRRWYAPCCLAVGAGFVILSLGG